MSARNLGCHYSLDGKFRRKPNPLKVLKEVNIRWKTWQPNICYENTIEVDVRVKAEFFLCFLSYYSNVWVWSEGLFVGNPTWAGEFGTLHHWALVFPFISNTSGFQVIGWMCGVAPVAATKTINNSSTQIFRNSLFLYERCTHIPL